MYLLGIKRGVLYIVKTNKTIEWTTTTNYIIKKKKKKIFIEYVNSIEI